MTFLVLTFALLAPHAGPADEPAPDLRRQAVEGRDPLALWLLLRRAGVRTVRSEPQAEPVAVDFRWAERALAGRSPGQVEGLLRRLGVPTDPQAETERATAAFRGQGTVLDSRHYRFLATAPPERVRDVARRLDAALELYQEVFGFAEPFGRRPVVRFFATPAELAALGFPEHVGGVYRSSTGELLVADRPYGRRHALTRGGGRVADAPWRILFHEAFHHYLDQHVPDAPLWFHEGFAEVFEAAELRGAGAELAVHRDHRRAVRDPGRLVPLPELLSLSPEQFNDPERQQDAYAQSWSLAYWLLTNRVADAELRERLHAFPRTFCAALRQGRSADDAFRAATGGLSPAEIEPLWRAGLPALR